MNTDRICVLAVHSATDIFFYKVDDVYGEEVNLEPIERHEGLGEIESDGMPF